MAIVPLWEWRYQYCVYLFKVSINFFVQFHNCFLVPLFRKHFELRMILGAKVDSRIRLLSDTINGIRAIKMFTWEKPFAKLIDNARKLSFVYCSSKKRKNIYF
jgi:hypothetical protein